jgi:hypothetical protein
MFWRTPRIGDRSNVSDLIGEMAAIDFVESVGTGRISRTLAGGMEDGLKIGFVPKVRCLDGLCGLLCVSSFVFHERPFAEQIGARPSSRTRPELGTGQMSAILIGEWPL